MISNKVKRQPLKEELERIGNRLHCLRGKVETGILTASEYCQIMAEYNIWMRRYDKIETEMLLLEVSPSKRTEMTERKLKSKLV